MMDHSRFGRKSAISLLEVCICIAIIGFVAALVFVAAGGAKSAAKQASCLSNLGQIGKAAHLYAADSDDLLPPIQTNTSTPVLPGTRDHILIKGEQQKWVRLLSKYASKEVFFCAADSHAGERGDLLTVGSPRSNEWTSYETLVLPPWKVLKDGTIRLSLSEASPSVPYVRDVILRDISPNVPSHQFTSHGQKINELFLDGHAKGTDL